MAGTSAESVPRTGTRLRIDRPTVVVGVDGPDRARPAQGSGVRAFGER